MTRRNFVILSFMMSLGLSAPFASADAEIEEAAPETPDFVLFSNVRVKPDQIVAFKKALLPYAELTRAEDGNAAYLAHQSPEDPAEFEMYEHWKSLDARTSHLGAAYTVQFFAQVGPMFESGYPARKKFIELK